jgi:hypothetical protein
MRRFKIDTSDLERLGSPKPIPPNPDKVAAGGGVLIGLMGAFIVVMAVALAIGWGILRAAGAFWSWLGW